MTTEEINEILIENIKLKNNEIKNVYGYLIEKNTRDTEKLKKIIDIMLTEPKKWEKKAYSSGEFVIFEGSLYESMTDSNLHNPLDNCLKWHQWYSFESAGLLTE